MIQRWAAFRSRQAAWLPLVVVASLATAGCGDGSDNPVPVDAGVVDSGHDDFAVVDSNVNDTGVGWGQPVVPLSGPTHERLSQYNLVAYDGAGQFRYHSRVVRYDLNTPLFSDYTFKERAIYVPEGATATYTESGVFDFPVGTVIIKSFLIAADLRNPTVNRTLLETRLLIRFDDGWRAFPYIWDSAQGDAIYTPGGEVRPLSFIDDQGEEQTATYLIPQRNQCRSCHEREDDAGEVTIVPIGPKARNLNRSFDYGVGVGSVNQLTRMVELGMLGGLPDIADVDAAYAFASVEAGGVEALAGSDLDDAARSYLDINCAHCHNPNGVQGITSQLFLNYDNTDQFRLGICKPPLSAGPGGGGLRYDIVPGSPDESVLVFRVETETAGSMMPLLGRSVRHREGAALLRAWVADMPALDCNSPSSP